MMQPEVLGSNDAKLRAGHTAVLVIDMVNDLVDPAGKVAARAKRPLEHARAVIPPIQRLFQSARQAGVTIVHAHQTTLADHASDSGPWLDARSRATYSVTDLCMDGTWGQQPIAELVPLPDERVIRKHRYSAFAGTDLDSYLKSRGIKTVVCCGVSTNACVEATAREAFSAEYYVVYAKDGCASWDARLHEATLETAAHRYGTVLDVDDIAGIWESPST